MNNLQTNLLTYIGYCLPGRFSYNQCSADFRTLGIKHEIPTLRKEFSILKKEKCLDFKMRYHKPVPILTSHGKLAIKTALSFKRFGDWDKKWRVVLFDLPQNERQYRIKLVEELRDLGFAPLQRSAYISPYPLLKVIEKYASYLGIRQHIKLLVVEKIEEERLLDAWPLKQITQRYQNFIKKTNRIQRHARLWALQAKVLELEFAEIFANDPHLPKEFLPENWPGQEAYQNFKEISNSY